MFGIVLAIVKMSACSRLPSAAASRIERTYPLIRETTVPAAITALLEMTDRSLVFALRVPLECAAAAVSRATALAGPPDRDRDRQDAETDAHDHPDDVADGVGADVDLVERAGGLAVLVGDHQPDRVDADRAGLGGEVHGLPGLGLEVDLLRRLDDQVVTGLCLDADPHRLVEVVGDGHRERPLVGGEQHEAGCLDAAPSAAGRRASRWTRRRRTCAETGSSRCM